MKNLTLLFALLVVALSCSNTVEKVYNKESLNEDMAKLKEALTEDDYNLLTGYILMSGMAGKTIIGETYGDILEQAKKEKAEREAKEAEEKRLAEKAKAEEAERIKRLSEALTVTMFDKGYFEYSYQDYLTYEFAFENKTNKDIKAFQGEFIINDLFDKEISKINLTYDDGVSSKEVKKWKAQTNFNQFDSGDTVLKNKAMDDLKFKWVPNKIIFSDGSALE